MRIPATWPQTYEFACRDKSCAPPPTGTGGSSPGVSRKAGPYGYQRNDKYQDKLYGEGRVISIEPDGIRVSFRVLPDIRKIADADVVRPGSAAPKRTPDARKDWRYIPKGRGSDDGYDAMKDAGYNSRYHRPR